MVAVLMIEVPELYPLVLLSVTGLPFITSFMMGGQVMSARTRLNVPLPNLYATPGVHDKAEEFNRVQRGHQNMFETLSYVLMATVVGGIKYPRVAVGFMVAYCLGNVFYLRGYANMAHDVNMARYKNPIAALKPVGLIGSVITAVTACVVMMM
uniref:Glutathione transferase n=1 Tax=Coccolithus braarudii TaxID=221442 RepID=A0A7S0L1D0_9EUKA|mmetsp:Transcript_14641/g.31730  ORF Transcript_14641/g.31730 Transcript_14641/m.31730 type:complete len:153 (+) Transcript_14641:49-507(+)|eukprot:CAMPEP_0183355782 /NCGR_PEP_ID=MMETSP0164_2-20130417/41821_1 /TAXON_ID=221442 /ORGANISM="Coccolithus pelagicus ssp braarudi, Strain PLY182g" /LENGTH=152 /DNA_ID=CAMNT_0025528997 /DNA_START=45 /DNA_END=503 /DNA_ORIENTATION=-